MKKNLKEFKPLWKFIKEDKSKLIIATIMVFAVEMAGTFEGYLNGEMVESITKLDLKRSIMFLTTVFILNLVFYGYFNIKGQKLFQQVENKISRKLSFNTYKKSLKLPSYAYEKTSSGEIINRITSDADTLSFTFNRLVEMFSSVISVIIIFIFVVIHSWIIGLEILFFLTILYFVVKKYQPMLIEVHKDRKKEQDKFSSIVNESIRGIREIKTLGVKNNLLTDTKELITILLNKSNKEIDISSRYRFLNKLVRVLLETTVFVTSIILLYYGKISLSFLIAMTYYVYRFSWLIDEINAFTETYQKLFVSISRVNDILENRLYKDEVFGDKTLNNVKGVIEFKNVKFGYPNERILLNNFNIKLEPNKKIAIVGKSGQGKSTIFNLLTRIFDPIEGSILIDGVDIKDLTEKELRNHISIIRQEPFIFNRSILDNFKMIDKNIKLEDVRKYTKMAYLDNYIMSLPDKYDTILGEGGVNLSGGQKQRLSIARTLAKKCEVILFDEATSSLDNNSQEYVKESIDNLVKNHTLIIVAHRLSTIIDSDIIYVIENGRVIESGKHEYLLKKCSTYKKLYDKESLNS